MSISSSARRRSRLKPSLMSERGRHAGKNLPAPAFMPPRFVLLHMPKVMLSEETVERLDGLRTDDESYDELVTELLNIYEAEELTMFRSGDG